MKIFFYLLALLLMAFACKKEKSYVESTSVSTGVPEIVKGDIPFADEATLSSVALQKGVVPYQEARKLALLELEMSIKESMKWHGYEPYWKNNRFNLQFPVRRN